MKLIALSVNKTEMEAIGLALQPVNVPVPYDVSIKKMNDDFSLFLGMPEKTTYTVSIETERPIEMVQVINENLIARGHKLIRFATSGAPEDKLKF
jgi:hypothetical protein